ncbi:hypothetical protein AOZ06_08605 [Kibdelosporangium phytohabitans]|uniref:ANTAR domain-containing protein n=2 Tax=Kibdelosporangium phytohabitans TaxID=860235 RepID=A0A0N9IDT3_9PSEU|nr:hypothetical protein AOZ06_08605 [Kibdelosporangium phytohabitans]
MRDHHDGLDALKRVCEASTDLLPVDGASISISLGPRLRSTLYASDAVSSRIESLQFSLGEGPCFQSFETRRPVLVPDLVNFTTREWPVFAKELARLRIGAIFAFPMQRGAIRIGVVDFYRTKPGWLSPSELAAALEVVDIATLLLLDAQSGPIAAESWPTTRLDHEQVHQATGVLIAAFGIPAEEALARLRAYAFARDQLVDEVARAIMARRLSPRELVDEP